MHTYTIKMEGLPSHIKMLLVFDSKHVSALIGHHQVALEECTNGNEINLYICQESPYVGLSGLKHVVVQTIETFACVTITPPFSIISTTNRMQQYKTCKCHLSLRILILKSFKGCN